MLAPLGTPSAARSAAGASLRVPETRRARLLHVVHELDYGGLERLVGAMVRLIDRTRFECHILTLSRFGRLAEGLEQYAELHRCQSIARLSMIWPRHLVRTMRAIAPDVVHTHSGVWYKASLAARHAGVPLLVHTDHGRHLPDPWRARWLDGMAARRTDAVVAVSDALAQQLVATVVPPATRVRVIVNGVDTDLFRPQPVNGSFRRALGLRDGAAVIGSVGRFAPVKGYDVMIEAFALLHAAWREGPPPHLVLVGDGSQHANLAALIEQRHLGDAVRLAGWQRDVERVYPQFDVFTLSSRSEGTPLGLLEAMSAAVCPVVTDVGGSAAVLGEGLRHRLVPSENPAALAAAWRDALADPERRRRDAGMARARVEQTFALRATVREYERIYLREV